MTVTLLLLDKTVMRPRQRGEGGGDDTKTGNVLEARVTSANTPTTSTIEFARTTKRS